MTKSRANKTAARRVERKYEKTTRRNHNHNRNRHRNRNRNKDAPQLFQSNSQVPELLEPSKNRTLNNHSTTHNVDLIQSSKSEQPQIFRFADLPTDIARTILTFLSIYDLTHARYTCVKLRNMTSTDNLWVRSMVMNQINPNDDDTSQNPCKRVILFITKTRYFGRPIHRAACKMKRRGPINDELFFACVAVVSYHQSPNFKYIPSNSPSWHEITMSCSHGLEAITVTYLTIYLRVRGLDETNMNEKGRDICRTEFCAYKELLMEDGSRTRTEDSKKYFFDEMDDYDFEQKFEESKDQAIPICGLTFSTNRAAKVAMDPLGLMSSMRNGKMARRILGLFMDFEKGVPSESVDQCRLIVKDYVFSVLRQPHRDDAEVIQYIVSNLFNVEPGQTNMSSLILASLTCEYPEEALVVSTRWATKVFGYHKRFVYDDWVKNRIEFAEVMVPFLLPKIQPARMPSHVLNELVKFVGSEANPMSKCVVLKEGVKRLIFSVVN